METETIFRIALPFLIFAYIAHRGYYTLEYGQEENTLKKREEGLASKLAGLIGLISFVAILAYVINPDWVVWASLPIPIWLRWAGFGVALAGFALLQWAQISLGKSWSDTPRMIKDQPSSPTEPIGTSGIPSIARSCLSKARLCSFHPIGWLDYRGLP